MTIELINVKHGYENFQLRVPELKFNSGEIISIQGKNGSGKTTLLKIIAGIIKNRNVYVDGNRISQNEFSKIAYMDSAPFFYEMLKVNEKLDLLKSIFGERYEKRIGLWMEALGLSQYENELIRNLSLGNRQKLGLVISLAGNPQFILLDEPLNGIDVSSMDKISDIFKCLLDEQKTVIFTTHTKSILDSLCTRLITMDDGEIISDIVS